MLGYRVEGGVGARSGWQAVASLVLCGALLAAAPARGQDPQASEPLTGLTLEQLLGVELTLATRRVQKLFDAAAAVYVISADDIRRSGATSLPEALRMVPGLHVARAGSSKWAISARGFTDEFANKLLVLVDGRTVYTPLYAGVYWDSQDLMLEDVERIEVVRGPGAALWGANAVNGIINIVTRAAASTQGTLVSVAGGSPDRAVIGLRHGGTLGADGHYRVYTKYFDRASFQDAFGGDAEDQWSTLRGGAQLEWRRGADAFRLDGGFYSGELSWTNSTSTNEPPYRRTHASAFGLSGGHLLGRLEHSFGASQAQLQVYYDHTRRGDVRESRDTLDVELQHALAPRGRHRLLWGAGYRRTSDRIDDSQVSSFVPSALTLDLASGFVQDEIELDSGRARLILGAKLEHNDFTGFELQPNVRLALFPSQRQVVWAAVSRAVRTPTRGERGLRYVTATFPGSDGLLNQVVLQGDSNFGSEALVAYELGYRLQPTSRLSFDVAAFVNDYGELRTFEPKAPLIETGGATGPVVVLPQVIANGADGRTQGLEIAANWILGRGLRLGAGYTGLKVDIRPQPQSRDTTAEGVEGDSPRHQLHLRAFADLPAGLELDTAFYYCSELANRAVPAWSRLDLSLAWRPAESLDLRLGVQDLLEGSQLEFTGSATGRPPTAVSRAVFARLAWQF